MFGRGVLDGLAGSAFIADVDARDRVALRIVGAVAGRFNHAVNQPGARCAQRQQYGAERQQQCEKQTPFERGSVAELNHFVIRSKYPRPRTVTISIWLFSSLRRNRAT